jgi:hypothetical protein
VGTALIYRDDPLAGLCICNEYQDNITLHYADRVAQPMFIVKSSENWVVYQFERRGDIITVARIPDCYRLVRSRATMSPYSNFAINLSVVW